MSQIIKCILLDDEPPALRLLEKYAKTVPFLEVVKASHKPLEVLKFIEQESVNALFLDIQMPGLTGLQLSKIIDANIKVVFTTAYSEYALESYDVNAIDYLLKPFTLERFYQAALKLKESTQTNQSVSEISEPYLFIKTDGKNNLERVNVKDILYVEAIKNYVAIHQKNKQTITYSTLKRFEENLPKNHFVKIHKSYAVALRHIEKTSSISVFVNGKELPLGNTYKTAFFDKLEGFKM